MSMLGFAIRATTEYIDHMPKSQRKKYGQFFTSKETAIFMAGLFEIPNARCGSLFRGKELAVLYRVGNICWSNGAETHQGD